MPPFGLVLASIASVQFGAALAATLFDELGPVGTTLLRTAFAGVILVALWRPRLRGHDSRDLALAGLFGLVLAAMNTCFYLSIDRIPLGLAVTLEFVGPLGLAVVMSRRAQHALWALLAGAGIVVLSGIGGELDPVGIALALTAGCLWAGYILLATRVGRAFHGGSGLALAMAVASVVMLVPGVADAGSELLDPRLLALGLGVAVLSSLVPYSLEMEALRRLPARVFGVLMSLEPAVAALAGFLVLGQDLTVLQILGIALVVVASAGAVLTTGSKPKAAARAAEPQTSSGGS